MSRYRGPKLHIIRSIGKLPGFTTKVSKKKDSLGQQTFSKKLSQYSVRLKEKQKLRFHYGISESQLLNYIKKARKKKGSSGKVLLFLLEMRLDNIIYRLNFAKTIVFARQIITHGHIFVNNKKVNIPSFFCKPKDLITIKSSVSSKKLILSNLNNLNTLILPQHLFFNKDILEAKILSLVNRKSISLVVNELLVVEYYSRKV